MTEDPLVIAKRENDQLWTMLALVLHFNGSVRISQTQYENMPNNLMISSTVDSETGELVLSVREPIEGEAAPESRARLETS